jgi:hypothetical protein
MGSVKILALVAGPRGMFPVEILIDGATLVAGLTAEAMRAVASQHPQFAALPIVALRYQMEKRT